MSATASHVRLETAQRFLRSIGHSDYEQVIDALSPKVSYRVPGTHHLAGTFIGRAEVMGHLAELVDRTMGTFDAVKWDDWMVGEYHVAGLVQIHVQENGRRYSGRVVFLVRFDLTDMIDSVEVFPEDQRSFSDFFGS